MVISLMIVLPLCGCVVEDGDNYGDDEHVDDEDDDDDDDVVMVLWQQTLWRLCCLLV